MIQVGEEKKHQPENENGAYPVEGIERRKIEDEHLDHRHAGDSQAGDSSRLERTAKPDADQRSREHQPPSAYRQTGSQPRGLSGKGLQLEETLDFAGHAIQYHGPSERPEAT